MILLLLAAAAAVIQVLLPFFQNHSTGKVIVFSHVKNIRNPREKNEEMSNDHISHQQASENW